MVFIENSFTFYSILYVTLAKKSWSVGNIISFPFHSPFRPPPDCWAHILSILKIEAYQNLQVLLQKQRPRGCPGPLQYTYSTLQLGWFQSKSLEIKWTFLILLGLRTWALLVQLFNILSLGVSRCICHLFTLSRMYSRVGWFCVCIHSKPGHLCVWYSCILRSKYASPIVFFSLFIYFLISNHYIYLGWWINKHKRLG